MGEASAARRPAGTAGAGAKERDYWWTVLAVDPVALPLVRLLAVRRWIGPHGASLASLGLGLLVGPAYAIGGRAGLAAGAVLFYVAFVFDCVDGKLARVLGTSSARGGALVPALAIGLVMVAVAILTAVRRRLRSGAG